MYPYSNYGYTKSLYIFNDILLNSSWAMANSIIINNENCMSLWLVLKYSFILQNSVLDRVDRMDVFEPDNLIVDDVWAISVRPKLHLPSQISI